MKNKLLRCSVIMSVVTLMALGQPSSANQTVSDSVLLGGGSESSNYRQKSHVNTLQVQCLSGLFAFNNSENPINSQYSNLNKNTKIFEQKIGLISEEDFLLLCQLVAAEAENQPFNGKCAVIGVVLNRSEYGWPFSSGIKGTIFQEGAFSCVSDGRFYEASEYISDEDKTAVCKELSERNYPEYLYFTADKYGEYGTPAEVIGDHYFCTR